MNIFKKILRNREYGYFALCLTLFLCVCTKIPEYCSDHNPLDPATQFCFAGEAVEKCDGREYSPLNQFCFAGEAIEKCGGEEYSPLNQFCFAGEAIEKCDGGEYSPATQFCFAGEAIEKCGGREYSPLTQGCCTVHNTVRYKCGDGKLPTPDAPCDHGHFNPDITYGSFTDSRDNRIYRTVQIGTQTWMAENLNFETSSGSWCYGDSPDNCHKYGRLYDWATVMAGASSSSASPSGVQGICPPGWHVPSDAEWTALTTADGGASTAGTKLKSLTGWGSNGNGTDDFGFSALPGGGRWSGSFYGAGSYGYWWSATENDATGARTRGMGWNYANVGTNWDYKSIGFSVRCLED